MSDPIRIDLAVQARSQVATQYTTSYKFLNEIAKVMARCQDIEDTYLTIPNIADIDTTTGVNLDVIGDIVGVSRSIPNGVLIPFFGFEDTPGGQPFGEEGVIGIGGRLRDEDEAYAATSVLGDPEYRLLIKAKIVKNHAIGTNNDILEGLSYIAPGSINFIDDRGGMVIDIGIGHPTTYIERVFIRDLDLLPRPNGVRIRLVVSFVSEGYFGFEGQVGAKGFGEEGIMDFGGLLAEEF